MMNWNFNIHKSNDSVYKSKLKLLLGGASSKFFHLKEFTDTLERLGTECRLVIDTDVYDGFPSKKIDNWFQTRRKFNELVNEFRPDAVFVDRQVHFGIAALKAKLPLFVHLRGDYWSEMKWARETLTNPITRATLSLKQRIAVKCFREADVILPLCRYLEHVVKEHYPKSTTHILQSGITPSRWYQVEGMKLKHPCVGLLQGAVIWGKTQEMLTLTKVLEAMPDVTFYWVGDGPYRDKILPILSRYKNFHWLGALQYPDKVREYLSEIDVYALVSGIDMSPLTLQEAQLMRKPVVATRVGGIPELMKDGETGFLVEKGDYKGWINYLSLLVNDQNKRRHMGEAGRKFVEDNFNWEKIAGGFLDSLRNVLN